MQIVAQIAGILGMACNVFSYQEKENRKIFLWQAIGGLMFFANFILIGAVAAALYNLTNLVRGALFAKNDGKFWRMIFINALYTACFVFSLFSIYNDPFQILLASLPYISLIVMTVLMWRGNGIHIRYGQALISSPSWIVHNLFNFSLGGLLCEIFMIASVIVSFVRYGKDGLKK